MRRGVYPGCNVKTNFTPGPWRVTKEIDGIYAGKSTVVFAGDKRVMSVGQTRLHHRECAEANAHLTAAAPEMYEALYEIIPVVSHLLGEVCASDMEYERDDARFVQPLRELLAKARGEE